MVLGEVLMAQVNEGLSFGTDGTFEVLTWNIEHFPKNGQTTVDHVIQIIEALDVDLLAIQEVSDTVAFNNMVKSLDNYEGYLESSWFAGLAYIYKTDVIRINDIYEIYTTSPYWSPFPRSPMVMDMNVNEEQVFVINNHFKCCGNGTLDTGNQDDEENRRFRASSLLKKYIDENLADRNVILLGDLNDILIDDEANNVFQMFLDDPDNYLFADYDIAAENNGDWSYPTWPSHLDHMLITNELFNEFESDSSVIETIKIDEFISGGWQAYDKNVSDHRPVGLKLTLDPVTSLTALSSTALNFYSFPNPMRFEATFSFDALKEKARIDIFNVSGQLVFSEHIPGGRTSLVWHADMLPGGVYFARLIQFNNELAHTRLVIMN